MLIEQMMFHDIKMTLANVNWTGDVSWHQTPSVAGGGCEWTQTVQVYGQRGLHWYRPALWEQPGQIQNLCHDWSVPVYISVWCLYVGVSVGLLICHTDKGHLLSMAASRPNTKLVLWLLIVCMCACVRACARARACVCVCVCVSDQGSWISSSRIWFDDAEWCQGSRGEGLSLWECWFILLINALLLYAPSPFVFLLLHHTYGLLAVSPLANHARRICLLRKIMRRELPYPFFVK